MADSHQHRPISGSPRLSGDDIAAQAFPAAFRGVSEAAVRAFLRKVADEHEALRARQDELLHQVDELEARLRERPPPGVQQDPLAALGEETARVLRSAQESAEQIRQSAEERARELLESAGAEARRLREEAETVAGERSRGAEEASAEMLREAERLVGELQRGAEERAAEFEAKAQSDARDELEVARRRAKELVAEAEVNRDRMVRELTRRKEVLELQIETLRAGRDRLLDAYRVVKRSFEEATDALRTSDTRAPSEATRRPQPAPAAAEAAAEPEPEAAEPAAQEPAAESAAEPAAGPEPDRDEAEPAAEEAAAATDTTRVGSFTLGELPDEPARPAGITGPARPLDPAERRDPAPIRVLGADPAAPPANPPAEQTEAERAESAEPDEGEGAAADERAGAEPEPGPEESAAGARAADEPEPEGTAAGEAAAGPAGEPDDAKPAPEEVEAIFARLRASHGEEPASGDTGAATPDDEASGAAGAGNAGNAHDTGEPAAEGGPDATLLGRRDEVVEIHVDELVRMVKRVLRDEQNVLLEALRRHRGVPAPDDVLPAPADQEAAFADATGPILAQACAAGAAVIGELDGGATGDADHGNGNGTGSAARTRELAAALAHELMEPLRSRLSEALHEAAAMDDTDAGERVRARYREWKGQRVADAARHALGAAFVRGVFDVLPDGEPLRWVSGDPSPCADCADNSLEATRRGAEFPTGHRLPPAHAGCRCVVAPVRAGVPATA